MNPKAFFKEGKFISMITLQPDTIILLYLIVTCSFLFFIWIFYYIKKSKSSWNKSYKELFICEYCAFVYLASVEREVNCCPRCKTFNKKNNFNKLRVKS